MSAGPTDYPTAVLKEAEAAMVSASSGLEYPYADRAGAQAYAAVLARHTVSARLTRSPGGVLVLDTPGEPIPAVLLSDEPPVDEDARELADAYERGIKEGFARAIRLGAAHLREIGEEKADSVVIAAGDWLEEWGQANALELTKQGAVSS